MPDQDQQQTPEQVREAEAARVRKSEEDGQKAKAYSPHFMPGFRPDVQVNDDDHHMQVIGDEEVKVAVRAGDTAVIVSPDHFMAPTVGVASADQTGAGTTQGSTGGAGGASTGAGTTNTTATGGPVETGQGSTSTSRAGQRTSGGGAGSAS